MGITMKLSQKLFDAGVEASMLDELVHDVMSKKASDINNNGMKYQIEFLAQEGFTFVQIMERLGWPNPTEKSL